MAKVELKKPIVEEIAANMKDATSVVLVDYRGLTVEEDTRLRASLREAGLTYKVYKNTMMRFAVEGTPFEALKDDLKGPNAVVISKEDATAPARLVANFAKSAPALELRSGIVEGQYYDQEGLIALSKVPSREELLSKLLGSLQSPVSNFARVLQQIADNGGAVSVEKPEAAQEAPAEEAPAKEAPAAEEAPADESTKEAAPTEEAAEEAPAQE